MEKYDPTLIFVRKINKEISNFHYSLTLLIALWNIKFCQRRNTHIHT